MHGTHFQWLHGLSNKYEEVLHSSEYNFWGQIAWKIHPMTKSNNIYDYTSERIEINPDYSIPKVQSSVK